MIEIIATLIALGAAHPGAVLFTLFVFFCSLGFINSVISGVLEHRREMKQLEVQRLKALAATQNPKKPKQFKSADADDEIQKLKKLDQDSAKMDNIIDKLNEL